MLSCALCSRRVRVRVVSNDVRNKKVQGRPGAHNPGFVHIGKHVGTSDGITGDHPKGLLVL